MLLRIDPALRDWFASAAGEQDRSRNQVMERWLQALPDAMAALESSKGLDATDVVQVMGQLLVEKMVSLGCASPFVATGWQFHQHQRREQAAELREDKR